MTTVAAAMPRAPDEDLLLTPSVDELATLYLAYSRAQAQLVGLSSSNDAASVDGPSVDVTRMYLKARRRFEAAHGAIVQEYWGEKRVVALLLTEGRVDDRVVARRRRGRRRGWEAPIFALHRTLKDLSAPTPFHAAFGRGDDLVARAVNVLRSREAQRVVVTRVFAAQESMINALETVGDLWAQQERHAQREGADPAVQGTAATTSGVVPA
jgi:hypothetical protein